MAVVAFPQLFAVPGFQDQTHECGLQHELLKRLPRKSILKCQKRPSIAGLRPLTRAITDVFPLELFRIIIDTLQHDRRTLEVCSRVCRAWLPLCREHFNPRMTVHPGNAVRFLDIVSSPHITIQNHIQHLVIHKQHSVVDHFFLVHTPTNTPTSPTPTPQSPSPFQLSQILAKAACLPHITKLTLQKGYGESAAMAPHLRKFQHLEELELRSFEFLSFTDLTAVISAQPNLRRLALTDIAWGDARYASPTHVARSPTDRQTRHDPVFPHLARLELFMEKQAELFNWMLARPAIPNVEYVELGGITDVDDAIAVSRFLRGLGSVLKHLRLYSPSRISQINLVHNTGLQSLTISHLHIGMSDRKDTGKRDRTNSAGDEVCTILSQLCSPHITKISLQLLFNEPECFAFIDWNQVSRTLLLPRYQKLQMMELRIPRLKRWMATSIVRSLPAIASRGILSVANG